MATKYTFMSAKISAKGVAKSSGRAEIASDVDKVAAENFITVLLLFSTLSMEDLTKADSGSFSVSTKKDNAAISSKDRILIARVACFEDSIDVPPLIRLFTTKSYHKKEKLTIREHTESEPCPWGKRGL